jgi:hypothetical protein
MAALAFVTTRSLPAPMVVFGLMHAAIALCLMGEKMAAAFEAKPGWREKWKLDEQGVLRVRRSVTRAASSLPALIMFALAPREGQDALGMAVVDASAVFFAMVGVSALVGLLATRRTWTVLALGMAGVATLGTSIFSDAELWSAHSYLDPAAVPHATYALHLLGLYAGLALLASISPFLGPLARFVLRGRRV